MKNAFLSLHLSIILAGWTGVFGKLIDLNAFMVVWWRIALGGACLWAIVLTFKTLQKTDWRSRLKFLTIGAMLGFQWIGFYAAIKASNVSIGVVSFSTVGFFTALFEPLLAKKLPSLKELGFSLLTILGISLIFHFDSRFRLGIFYGVISAAGAALLAILMKKAQRHHNAQTVMLWQFAGAFLGLSAAIPFVFQAIPDMVFFPALWPDGLYLVIFATVVTIGMYLLQLQALRQISAFTVNLSYNLEPIYSILIAMMLFNEARELNLSFWIGLNLIAISVLLQTLSVQINLRHKDRANA